MHFLIIGLFVVALVFGPQFWARYVFKRYSRERESLSGTGGELARHLLDRFEMSDVVVEKTKPGADHYDPSTRTVRLSPDNFDNRSLTAVAVATHEVGHAIQHHHNDPKLELRTRLITLTSSFQRIAGIALAVLPIAMVVTKNPLAGGLMLLVGVLSLAGSTVVHLITLPVELDASFGKALPILREGYVDNADIPAIERILRAAALTYVAASLASLLSVWRWLALLRR